MSRRLSLYSRAEYEAHKLTPAQTKLLRTYDLEPTPDLIRAWQRCNNNVLTYRAIKHLLVQDSRLTHPRLTDFGFEVKMATYRLEQKRVNRLLARRGGVSGMLKPRAYAGFGPIVDLAGMIETFEVHHAARA